MRSVAKIISIFQNQKVLKSLLKLYRFVYKPMFQSFTHYILILPNRSQPDDTLKHLIIQTFKFVVGNIHYNVQEVHH